MSRDDSGGKRARKAAARPVNKRVALLNVQRGRLPRPSEYPDGFTAHYHGAFTSGFEAGFRGWEYDDPYRSTPNQNYSRMFNAGYRIGEQDALAALGEPNAK